MLRIRDAVMASGPPKGGFADSHLAGQAGLFAGDRWLAWQNLEGLIHLTALPSLTDIAAWETGPRPGPTGARP
jgi:hypothetical protein